MGVFVDRCDFVLEWEKESFGVGPITSSNEEIAVVDENGQVTAKQKGEVQIIATYRGKKQYSRPR
ncbi:Ig-like domain-containing protein [Brevibacillus reuszeri]|uniref:Ig-like domain-containing protein n=1 Tax=Brevibacillus reuszeri TaxID=54915 RepID=UPI003D20361B